VVRGKCIAIVILVALLGTCHAATVRGLLRHGNSPAFGITVTVLSQQNVRSFPARSGSDGMYYIPNVKAGTYTLEEWTVPNKPPLTFSNIQVTEPVTNVNPINVP
jgi:hypothetical protein